MKKEEILAGLRLVGRWILSLLPVGVVLALCFWGISQKKAQKIRSALDISLPHVYNLKLIF